MQALKLLIDRAGGIRKARNERNEKASALIDMEDDRAAFDLYLSGNGSVKEGARQHIAQKEKQAHDHLSPKAKAVAIWADAEFITPEIRSQLPPCMHRALLADSTINHLWDDSGLHMRQLAEQAALKELLRASNAGEPAAVARLDALTKETRKPHPNANLWQRVTAIRPRCHKELCQLIDSSSTICVCS